jgi:ribA/ribD-fused uncharacterized protein
MKKYKHLYIECLVKVDTISLNTKVFNKIKEKLNQGYTVLTATPAFMRNADYVFTTDINNERLLSRFKTIEEVESFLAKESEAIAKSGKSVQYVTNLEDVLVKKPEAEQSEPRTNTGIKVREEIQPGFFNYGLLDSSDEKIILDAAIKQTNEQGYPVKKGVVYAHWGNMWAVTDKGADAFSVFGQYLKRSKETTGFGKNLPKIDLPSSNINHNDGGKGWYDYYPTDQNGKPLKKIPQEIKDILQKKLGIDMSVYDSAIINSYGEITELTRHIDNTEDKGFAYKIPIVSISLIGDSLFWYSKPSNNPSHPLPDKEKIGLKPGQVVVFGGPSRAMAHRVENGKSRNSIDIKNSVNQLKTERINITLRRALPLSEEEYNNWVNNNKTMSNVNQQVEVETPIQQIYSQLGNKTQSENVVIVNIKTKDGKYDRDANFKEAKANNRIYSMEIDSDLSFSNPWASFERKGTIKTNTTKEAVINYIDWLTTDKFKNVKPERRKWILDILKSGQLKNRPIQYYAELKEPSHTTALDYLINKYDWNKQPESQTGVKYSIKELKQNSNIEKDAIKFIRKDRRNLDKGYFEEFSNFTPSNIEIVDDFGLKYKTVEHYYQAQKTLNLTERKQFTDKSMTAYQAKQLGKSVIKRVDWETVKFDVMREGLRQKFQDKKFMDLLKSTGNKQIIEWTWWGDKIWGMSDKTNDGANALGKLLMELRDSNQETQTTETRELIYKDKDKRILVEYPTEIKVPEINYVFNTNKLLEILKVFSVEDDGTAEDGREFDEEILDEYGMTDSQYQYALKNQKVLSYLLNAMNEEVFVDSEGNAIYFNGFNDIIIEILKRNEKLIDTKQLTLKFPDFDKGSAFEGKDDCLIKK